MALVLRGILWFGIYLFLILLPLLTAVLSGPRRPPSFLVALGVGAGFVGLSLMCLEFALISRIKAAAQAFGEDSLQLFHNLMGIVAIAFLIAHPVLLVIAIYPANCWLNPFAACANAISRSAALSLYALMLLVGLSVWRKKLGIKYELWQITHGLLALFILIAAMVHINVLGRFTSAPIMRAVWLLYGILVAGLLIQYKILSRRSRLVGRAPWRLHDGSQAGDGLCLCCRRRWHHAAPPRSSAATCPNSTRDSSALSVVLTR